MSRANVELVGRIFDGWSRGDFSVGKDLLTGDFEWRQHAEAVESGTRRGAAVGSGLKNIFAVYEDFRISPDRYVDAGDKVVVVAHNRATERRSGVRVDQTFTYVWTVRSGKLSRLEVYAHEDEALAAAGVSGLDARADA